MKNSTADRLYRRAREQSTQPHQQFHSFYNHVQEIDGRIVRYPREVAGTRLPQAQALELHAFPQRALLEHIAAELPEASPPLEHISDDPPYLIMRKVPGISVWEHGEQPITAHMSEKIAATVAKWSQIPLSGLPEMVGGNPRDAREAALRWVAVVDHFVQLNGDLVAIPYQDFGGTAFIDQLLRRGYSEAMQMNKHRKMGLVHTDLPANLMFDPADPDSAVHLIDFDGTHAGDPAKDYVALGPVGFRSGPNEIMARGLQRLDPERFLDADADTPRWNALMRVYAGSTLVLRHASVVRRNLGGWYRQNWDTRGPVVWADCVEDYTGKRPPETAYQARLNSVLMEAERRPAGAEFNGILRGFDPRLVDRYRVLVDDLRRPPRGSATHTRGRNVRGNPDPLPGHDIPSPD